jgi:hypothetical protein
MEWNRADTSLATCRAASGFYVPNQIVPGTGGHGKRGLCSSKAQIQIRAGIEGGRDNSLPKQPVPTDSPTGRQTQTQTQTQ